MKPQNLSSLLITNDLTFGYSKNTKITFPNIEVSSSHPLLILGDSGCGKTTFLHLLSGLLQPSSGSVIFNGIDLSVLTPAYGDQFRGENIGMVFQKPHFIESLSVYDNIKISPYFNPSGHKLNELDSLLKLLNLSDVYHKLPAQLSSGEQQRLSILRAIMHEPQLLLCDEPTSALDNKNCNLVLDLLLESAEQLNAVLIICTHDERIRSKFSNEISLSDKTALTL